MILTNWDYRWLAVADHIATWSKDPRRKIGCVIVDKDNTQLSGGYNGFPRGISDDNRLDDKQIKNKLIVHAEANAIAAAARNGHSVKGATIYISQIPCSQCAALIIQAGILKVIAKCQTGEYTLDTCQEWDLGRDLLTEAKIDWFNIAEGSY